MASVFLQGICLLCASLMASQTPTLCCSNQGKVEPAPCSASVCVCACHLQRLHVGRPKQCGAYLELRAVQAYCTVGAAVYTFFGGVLNLYFIFYPARRQCSAAAQLCDRCLFLAQLHCCCCCFCFSQGCWRCTFTSSWAPNLRQCSATV
jgi:hypothetical protein